MSFTSGLLLQLTPNTKVDESVAKQPVKCHHDGCRWTGLRSALAAHEEGGCTFESSSSDDEQDVELGRSSSDHEDAEDLGFKGLSQFPDPRHTSPARLVGLSNQGATCYLNSLIQSLFMTPEFRNAVYRYVLYLLLRGQLVTLLKH